MMNCREVTKMMGRQSPEAAAEIAHGARQHLSACARCRRRWSLERMAVALVRAHAETSGEMVFPSPYFFTRLRARIHAERANASATFWDAAVATAHGWLLAFGSVAAILLAAFV